jgi:Trk K+ transport system NAD-binding subunit
MRDVITPKEAAEERRLWADYYEAIARVVEIIRAEGTTETTLSRIVVEDAKAAIAMRRIKEIRGIRT